MPVVNGKHYSYDKKGKAAAKKAKAAMMKPMMKPKKMPMRKKMA